MRLITRKGKATLVAAQWYRNYYRNYQWMKPNLHLGGPEAKYAELLVLGDNPDPDEVDRIIGNTSWTECRCDECNKAFEQVVQVGDEPDYESSTAKMCKGCLKAALKLL